MKKMVSVLLIMVLFILPLIPQDVSAGSSENPITKASENNSSIIFDGKVLSVTSYWDDPKNPSTIYSIASISVDTVQKSTASIPNIVQVKYLGGTVGNISVTVFADPYGSYNCYKDEVVKIYANPNMIDGTLLNALSITDITPIEVKIQLGYFSLPNMIDSLPSVQQINEYQRLGFATTNVRFVDSASWPLHYRVNPLEDNGLTDAQVRSTIQGSFTKWQQDAKSAVSFVNDGDTTINTWNYFDANAVFFQTQAWFNQQGIGNAAAACWVNPVGDQFDIAINDGYYWQIGTGWDLNCAVVHEVGHTFGLADLFDSNDPYFGQNKAVMTGVMGSGWLRPNLYSTDQEGVRYIYPDPSYPANTVSVTYPSDGQIIYGDSYVRATVGGGSIGNVKVQVTSLSDFSYSSGWLTMTYSSPVWYTIIHPPIYHWYWVTVRSEKTSPNLQHSYGWTRVDQEG